MKFFACGMLTYALLSMIAPGISHALISVAEKQARDARPKSKPFLVVLDPGHGGIDHGTTYEGNPPVAEKDLTLILAREVAKQLKAHDIRVKFTRNGDYEMPLAARTAFANRLKADVFLSIHLNSMPGLNPAQAQGVETYILNHETDSTSKRLAQLENQVIGGAEAKEGEDVALILKDLRLDANLPESKRLACMIQDRVIANAAHFVTSNRGVREALFFVLLGADMPSALIEAGFLSNPHDRDWLMSLAGQKAFGKSVARAIYLFRRQKNTPLARQTLTKCKVHEHLP